MSTLRILSSLALAATFAFAGCNKKSAGPDPTYDKPLADMNEVDDAHAEVARGDGDRVRATYKPTDGIRGAAEPLVTIVEYSDFQCPFCGTFAQTLHELEAVYPEDLRVVFHQYPMPMHPQAPLAAKAAIAAQAQGRFWAMHDHMFANRSALSREQLVQAAGSLGLDTVQFEADLDSEETEARLSLEKTLGRRLGVRGTPSFFINGRSLSGAMDAQALGAIIDEERAFAKTLMDAGVPRNELYARIMRAANVAGAR